MLHPTLVIARFTVLECWRTRLPITALSLIGVGLLAATVTAALAVTASTSYFTGVYAGVVRLAAVALVVLYVATSVAGEQVGGFLEFTLARPISRGAWYVGRLVGFLAVAAFLGGLGALPLLLLCTPAAACAWMVSLIGELGLMTAVCLAVSISLRQVAAVVMATLAFYVLARALDAVVLMADAYALATGSWSDALIGYAVSLIAWMMPALGRHAQSIWLSTAFVPADVVRVLAEAAWYTVLATAVGLFDLYRRE